MEVNKLTEQIIGAAIEVHRILGPGLLESSYEVCLLRELSLREVKAVRQVALPIVYKGLTVPEAYRIDLLVEDTVIVELKTVSSIQEIHLAQMMTYLRASGKTLGLIINFNIPLLKDGIKRVVLNHLQ